MRRAAEIARLRMALEETGRVLTGFCLPRDWTNSGTSGVGAEADRAADEILKRLLPREGEGWLSEESPDDLKRLERRRVWVVDPLDGTKEFEAGLPEWCISAALVEDGRAVAGGICNPATGELFLGSLEDGVTLNGRRAEARRRSHLAGAQVLASRSELRRGDWDYPDPPFSVSPMGSVAYKLALVAAGRTDATWTLSPKHEWDVAAGVVLVLAAGGTVRTPSGRTPTFNQRQPLLDGLVATSAGLYPSVSRFLAAATPGSR